MVAPNKRRCAKNLIAAWHEVFLAMLPAIRTHARIAFRHLGPEAREEAVQDAICNACCAVARLAELGKLDLAYPSVLAMYAVKQVKDGRKVGCKLNIRDVMHPYCQRRKNITVERLDHFDEEEDAWTEVVVEDRTAGPADIARVRIDFGDWLRGLPRRERRIAETLATGEQTGVAARKFRVSPGRISQIRAELKDDWQRFQGDEPTAA
jgi:hypothetical protein